MPMKPMCVREQGKRAHISSRERAERVEREEASLAGSHDHIEPPRYLTTKKMRDRFAFIVSILHGCSEKLCTDADVDAVGRYVLAEAEYVETSRDLRACRRDQKREPAWLQDPELDPASRAKLVQEWRRAALSEKRQLQRAHNQAFKTVTDAARAIGLTVDARLRFDLRETEGPRENRFDFLLEE